MSQFAAGRRDILEIGGGFGGIGFHLRKETSFDGTYTDVDIPEVLMIAAAFLMATLSASDIFLYGDPAAYRSRKIHLLPHYRLPKVRNKTIGVVFNSHSLTEMDYSTIREYLSQIERISPYFFLHMNHEYQSTYGAGNKKKKHALVGPEGIDFARKKLRRVYRAPETLTNDGTIFAPHDYWESLYVSAHVGHVSSG